MGNSFNSIIEESQSFLVLLPHSPHLDLVAGGLGLYLTLQKIKETSIACSSPMLVEFNRLIGVNKISQETSAGKHLIIKFTNYEASNIQRVSYDLDKSSDEMFLRVIPKAGVPSPKREQVTVSYSGVAADNVILIGGDHEGHFPHLSPKDATNGKIIHIGTRDIKFSGNWNLVSFARPASSVSEIVAGLIRESGQVVDSEAATNLLIGIEEGSKHFTHPGVSAETFELVADLLRAGAKRIATPTPQRQFFPPGAIPGETPEPEKKEGKREGMEVTEAPKDWTRPPKVYTGTGGIPIS